MKNKEIICDVLVVGAGLSGIAAAVSACQRGKKTVLLDKNNFLAGTVFAGMHRYLCGLYGNTSSQTINDGITRKIIYNLKKLSPNNRSLRRGKVYVFAFRSKDLNLSLQALVKKRKNLKVILDCRAYSVKQNKGWIHLVRAKSGFKIFNILPKVVVDASGNGAIIKLSQAKYRAAPLGNKRQLAGFSFRLKGIKDTNELLSVKVPYYLKLATYSPLDNCAEGLIRLNIPASRRKINLKKEAVKAYNFLRQRLPEFKNAYIARLSPSIAEREGIRLHGQYTLTANDVLQARKFKDGVVKNSWPIEIWDRQKGPQYKYLKPGTYYEIPLRCLKSKNIKNLLAAGRCISVTHEALGSTRAAGTCIALGEQAGIEAARLCNEYI